MQKLSSITEAGNAALSKNYDVKDLKLAEQGKLRVEWATQDMPVLQGIAEHFQKEKPLKAFAWLHVCTLLPRPRF